MSRKFILEPPYPENKNNPFGLELGQKITVVITTTSTMEEAKELSRELVGNELAACVQLSNITSIYTWKGEVEEEDEIRLMIKVAEERRQEVVYYLKEHHPYDTPEIILTRFTSDRAYFEWCRNVSGLVQ